jgi:hypothetical protein
MSSRAPVYTNDADIRFFEHQPADCVAGHGPNVQHCRLRGSKTFGCVLRAFFGPRASQNSTGSPPR